ncbi:MAG: HugZ family protein [Alphaproteobacteria bacterium]
MIGKDIPDDVHDRAEAARGARSLIRAARTAALSTALAGEAGRAFVSLVAVASAADGGPLLLLSDLAEHSRNLKGDARLALLYDGTAGLAEPLEGPRLSVLGRLAPAAPKARARFLARHPKAARYADFQDFQFYHVAIDRAHLVGGFGRIRWLSAKDLLIEAPAALVGAETDILAHMNGDHGDAVALYATKLLGCEAGPWRMTGLDAEGCDLESGLSYARLNFASPVSDGEGARRELTRLARAARDR